MIVNTGNFLFNLTFDVFLYTYNIINLVKNQLFLLGFHHFSDFSKLTVQIDITYAIYSI